MMPSHKMRILVATQPVDFRKGHCAFRGHPVTRSDNIRSVIPI